MTPELKEKWLTDLKSGKYPKTRGHLKDKIGYCCLGVLCETAGIGFRDELVGYGGSLDEARWFAPKPDAGGFKVHDGNTLSDYGLKQFGLSTFDLESLIDSNDNHDTFDPVIEYIEEHL